MSGKGGGGGAESFARQRQYDYRANSNLVLTAETRTREATEPSGEPETLWNNMKGKMGDRVQYGRPEEEKKVKKRKDPTDDLTFAAPQPKRRAGGGVLDLESVETYRPKTRETQAAYETLLSIVQGKLGDYATDVIAGAADEVLGILKSDKLKDPEKQEGVGDLFGGTVDSDEFFKLVTIGKMITDFQSPEDPQEGDVLAGDALDEEAGVAVEFEGEDAEDEDDEGDVVMEDEDQDEGGVDAAGNVTTGMKDDGGEEEAEEGLHPQDIDAYWLQRRISKANEEKGTPIDADRSQELAAEVFRILQGSQSNREAESSLYTLMEFNKFDMIKELLRDRLKIVWCTRLERADHDERKRLEAEMRGSPETEAILDTLNATRATAKERHAEMERKIRQEARQLRQAAGGGQAAGEVGAAAAGRHQVDIDSLAFSEGAHTMSNVDCTLPKSSYRTSFKGYEEVHVPPLKHKPYGDNEKHKEIRSLPEWMQPAFRGMASLNRIQSRVCDTALNTAENLLICAPTGSGKTNCSMLAILHQIGLHRDPQTGKIDTSKFKIVYVAPMKALVAEMVGNFSTRLEPFGITVRELTGDINLTKKQIDETQIIVTTPEKWDIITRKSGDRAYTQLVKLIIIDEIHLLHDERGAVLESIVARTVRQIETTQELIRLVGLSATLPNYDDVATFLRVKHDVGLFYFDNSFRPCPLAQQYIGVSVKKPLQRFKLMNEICYAKVLERIVKQHQVLIFVHSRKETAKTAKYFKEEALREDKLARFMGDSGSQEILRQEAETTSSNDLKDLLPYGIAIHHAGMARADRTMVEELFGDKHIKVLVSTATLAWGVNLPAHTVIIKGTQVYNPVKGAWGELSPLDVMQMFGRAGRPQFDNYGEGIIITGQTELRFYLSLFNMQLPIESQYVATIPDNLNAEVVLGTVTNLQEAADWLGYTYLYVRMLMNGNLYGVPLDAADSDPRLMERRLDLAHSAATLLDRNNLINYDRRSGTVRSTDLGRIASHYYIKYTTLATYNDHLKPTMGDIELLRLFALSDEFKYIIVRDEEKLELAKLLERVPIPVKEGIEEPIAKINVLLQAYISQLKLEGLAMSADMVYVTQSAGRLMRCLFEICLKRGWASLTERAMNLCKMINKRQWGSQTPLRQFKGIPTEVLGRMEKKDLAWERYYDLSAQELGELIRVPKLGKTLHRFVHQFPKLDLAAYVQPITRTVIKVDLTITPDFQWEDKVHGFVEPFWILVEDSDSENLLHSEYFLLKKAIVEASVKENKDHTITFTIPISEPLPPQYFVRVVSDKWLSCEAVLPVSFRHLLLPEKNPPPTELLDLQPLPVTALKRAEFESLYSSRQTFNAIQTQVFNALYESDDNCLIAAPTASGKTICAEFAVLRVIRQAMEGKCVARIVYIAPVAGLAAERFADWSSRFGQTGLGLNVVQLVGETTADVKAIEKGNIIISSPEHWDMLSRRWKQRKNVQHVKLFIVDELHLVGGRNGPVIEVITSRMRQISNHNKEQPIRIVGLSTSLANAKDVGDWIGASAHGLFNFPAAARPDKLEIQVHGIDLTNMEARMQAMARPAYAAICNYAGDSKPALLFVPTRKHARSTALDMLTFAAAEGKPQRFLQVTEEDLTPFLAQVKDRALEHALRYGVGFLYETMPAVEKDVVNRLFASGAIQVVTATAPMCWGMTLQASLVVVMGTQYYDASGATGVADYPLTDLLQIMGRASKPDKFGARAILLCHSPRKQYYQKFLYEPFPVESHLDHALHDHFVAEIGTRTVQSKQDAVDYLTWTFLFRRILQNPNYYNLQGRSHRHLSDHLSDLTENTLQDLVESNVIVVKENDMDLELLNLGMISSYYYISYTTIEIFSSSLTAKTKLKGLLDIVTNASELDDLPMRPGEEETVRRLLIHAHMAVEDGKWTDPHTKANALLQCHFSRTNLSSDMQADQRTVLPLVMRLLQACVDVVSSNSWLNPALAAMEMSQMVVQGMWERDSLLMQLPHFTKDLAAQCKEANVESIFDLLEMKEEARRELLQMTEAELQDVARVCNRYPDIQLEHKITGADGESVSASEFKESVPANSTVAMQVDLTREQAGDLRPVDAPRFPTKKEEQWWLVVGDPKANTLLAIKRISLLRKATHKLAFQAPSKLGSHHLVLYFMCDSYMGCDQEYEFDLEVTEAEADSSDGDMEE